MSPGTSMITTNKTKPERVSWQICHWNCGLFRHLQDALHPVTLEDHVIWILILTLSQTWSDTTPILPTAKLKLPPKHNGRRYTSFRHRWEVAGQIATISVIILKKTIIKLWSIISLHRVANCVYNLRLERFLKFSFCGGLNENLKQTNTVTRRTISASQFWC